MCNVPCVKEKQRDELEKRAPLEIANIKKNSSIFETFLRLCVSHNLYFYFLWVLYFCLKELIMHKNSLPYAKMFSLEGVN